MTDTTDGTTDGAVGGRARSIADLAARVARLESRIEGGRHRTGARDGREADRDGGDGAGGDEAGEQSGSGAARRGVLAATGLLAALGLGVAPAGADPQGQVGTADDPLRALYAREIRGGSTGALGFEVDGSRALSLGGDAAGDAGTVLAGHSSNVVADGVVGATVSGGGFDDGSTTQANEVSADYGTVGGGRGNVADGAHATVGGGLSNAGRGENSTVGGGSVNTASGENATVAGGSVNIASGERSTAGGGTGNLAQGPRATVAGGNGNVANSPEATVGGGNRNVANDRDATVGGGSGNVAGGRGATVPGGRSSRALRDDSFAAGRNARADAPGAFVWGDGSSENVRSTTDDEFKIQAGGGALVYSTSDRSTGVNLPPGGGSWNAASSRAIKSNVVPVDTERVLEGVRGLEVSRWEYDAQEGVEHVGPMAGAFRDAFGLGADAAHIAGVDADGVALAAVQALADGRDATDERVDRLETATERGRDRVAALEARNQRTAARVATLEAENEALRERLRALEDRLDDAGSGRTPPGGAGE
jgi:hypothetical protein